MAKKAKVQTRKRKYTRRKIGSKIGSKSIETKSTVGETGSASVGPDYANDKVAMKALEDLEEHVTQTVFEIANVRNAAGKKDEKFCTIFSIGSPFGELFGYQGNTKAVVQLLALTNININAAAGKALDLAEMIAENPVRGIEEFLRNLEAESGGRISVVGPFSTKEEASTAVADKTDKSMN